MKSWIRNILHWNRHVRRPLKRLGVLMAIVMLVTMGLTSALSADTDLDRKEGVMQSYPVAATETIYKGALVVVSATGYLEAGTDAASKRFAGVAYEKKDNSSGADGALNCRVHTKGVFLMTATSITQAMVGQMMYLVDDATIDDTTGGTYYIPVGRLVEYVSTTSGYVDIGQRHLVGGADNIMLAPNATKKFEVHTWGAVMHGNSMYMRSDYSAYINSWIAGGLEVCGSSAVRLRVAGKGWNVGAGGICSTAYTIRCTGVIDFGTGHSGSLQLPQKTDPITQPTEGMFWYNATQEKLQFSTSTGKETVTSA